MGSEAAPRPSPAFEDTIAAVVTPLGPGGLGVVRVSGPRALSVAAAVFRASSPLDQVPTHTLHHGTLLHDGLPLDDAVASVFRGPRSYTGEDVVEISCHGNADLMRQALAACLSAGARTAGPGEFTKRAFLNGKMDLAQAEAVALMVSARSAAARRWALDQLQGRLSAKLDAFRKDILSLLAHLEASLDFAEEEVPDLSREELLRRADALAETLSRLLATAPRGRAFRDGVRAVLTGRPNVGKSSLFNALLGHDRAIVTDAAGTTRDTLEEVFDAQGVPVVLTDTAGLREGRDAAESEGVARARRSLENADVALWTLDAADPFRPEDLEIRRALPAAAKVVVVLNKADRVPDPRDRMLLLERAGAPAVCVSAATGEGLPDLRSLLARTAVPAADASLEAEDGITLLNDRHEALARAAAEALQGAARAVRAGDPVECAAPELRRALDALNHVAGKGVSDEVLDEVFSRFCIGK